MMPLHKLLRFTRSERLVSADAWQHSRSTYSDLRDARLSVHLYGSRLSLRVCAPHRPDVHVEMQLGDYRDPLPWRMKVARIIKAMRKHQRLLRPVQQPEFGHGAWISETLPPEILKLTMFRLRQEHNDVRLLR